MPSSPVADPRFPRRPPVRAACALVLASLLALGGCGGGPAPRLYMLEPLDGLVEPTAQSGTDASDTGFGALGIAVVTLPGYARDPRIASRDGRLGVTVDDEHRWAESPEEAITRVLLERLRLRSGANVLSEPWPRAFEPDARVEVAFDQLLRTSSGGATASGRILLLSGDGRDVFAVRPFRLERGATSTAPQAFFIAAAALVDDIARLAIETLLDERAPA